ISPGLRIVQRVAELILLVHAIECRVLIGIARVLRTGLLRHLPDVDRVGRFRRFEHAADWSLPLSTCTAAPSCRSKTRPCPARSTPEPTLRTETPSCARRGAPPC